jgi:phosphoribosylformylglycinamidine cyclo-ligase
MVAVVDAAEVDRALAVLTARHVPAWVLGEVRKSRDVTADGASKSSHRALLRGEHPRF